ncbi:MAG TPA: DUF4254 domain-containing protein [Lacibacter sp.]|nr:DUF4254 domain-containing protein [Lacibacter sp.]HMO87673.1 DUF4254 domain-containing protein [Lacibacter sp.]HMP87612.1 DUF4254 domain-containing protein [Lacibacter sp.]
MLTSQQCFQVFESCIRDYHVVDHVDQPLHIPYAPGTAEHLLYRKNWIDTVQWHLEDIIRNPAIDPAEALQLKRRIDASNQDRTDLVEVLDNLLLQELTPATADPVAPLNTETPAWAIDRLSILALKIYHMRVEAERTDVDEVHRQRCSAKLAVLLEQQADLSGSIDALLDDIRTGKKRMKLYRQMKMYNDPSLNPVLYKK